MMGTQDSSTRDFSLDVLGTKMQTRSLDEALVQAGLDWEVAKHPLVAQVPELVGMNEDGSPAYETRSVPVPGKFGVVRGTSSETIPRIALGVVGDRYKHVQNRDAFGFVDTLLGMGGDELHVDVAGSMYDGRKVFLDVKLPNTILVGGEDPVEMRMLAVNTHDGTAPFSLSLHINRIACTNAIEMTRRTAKAAQQHWSLRHTSGIDGKVQQAREALSLTFAAVDEFQLQAETLISKSITERQFERLVENVFPIDKSKSAKAQQAAGETRLRVRNIYRDSPTQESIHGTAWGALNAFVEYADWAREVRIPKKLQASLTPRDARALAQLDSRHVQAFKSNVMGRVLAMK